ncbi:PcF and SCR74-like cys-rich secreted peptide, putative [Phytophthora infestans T30-4]|uniref:PcF and SCR74-like cys-rich secreted peptide, putative n=1 Tax=Phytophthora infestans (strain T30-4) TaxID=403677 RepID=D0NPI3_PHYIT|nr:PcF and SCR74-like cys-rich secreted peptide, putative [Phytophthora infestans T30-4]EEY62525.1 PcF and SCR74-like cys-rich secreted peptide, putative [Phytophthora infestans T30-4]|eukprot:XP_002899161.1 PcF and SCR74-like cys-rich secreted peptide, putative [Phytophthora infestans T30-4]
MSCFSCTNDSNDTKHILLFDSSNSIASETMNLGIYAVAALSAMIATTTNAQQLCSDSGCAYVYSESNLKTSECCRKQSMSFNECCRVSCNFVSPC